MSDFRDDLDETPDETGEPPHPMGPWGKRVGEDLTDSEEWLGETTDDA